MASEDNKNDNSNEERKGVRLFYSPRMLQSADHYLKEEEKADNNEESGNDLKAAKEKVQQRMIFRLVNAIVRREEHIFEQLLPKIKTMNARGQMNWTPLMWAVHKKRTHYVQRILSAKKVSLKHRDKNKRTVLLMACEKGYSDIVQLLLDHKPPPNVNAVDKTGASGLFMAASKGNTEIMDLLLRYGADPNICNREGISPLMRSCRIDDIRGVISLLHGNTNINIRDDRGRNALMIAVAENRVTIVKLLLKQFPYPDLNAVDYMNFDWNCLMWAIYRRHEEVIALLLKSKLSIQLWHLSSEEESVCDMCSADKRLSHEIAKNVRVKVHMSVFPAITGSQIVGKLRVPYQVVGLLLAFVY